MALRFMAFVALLRLTIGSSIILGYSTLPHFLCNGQQNALCQTPHQQQLSSSALPDLIAHLSAPDTVHNNLPLARINTPPELLLFINSNALRADIPSVLRRISVALSPSDSSAPSPSSFHALSDEDLSDSASVESIKVNSVDQLMELASDSSSPIFDNGRTDVVSLSVADEREEGLLAAMQSVADRTGGKMAVLWSSRTDEDADAAPPEAPKDDDSTASGAADKDADAAAADAASADDDATKAGDAAPKADDTDSADDSTTYVRTMYKPELTDSQLAGLLVALVFIILFVPGFMCLWRIQPPQYFDTTSKTQ